MVAVVLLLGFLTFWQWEINSQIPDICELRKIKESAIGLTFQQFEKLADAADTAVYTELPASEKWGSLSVKQVLVNENVLKAYGMEYYGMDISAAMVAEGDRVAVIEEEAALAQFFSRNVIGETVKLGEEKYTIIGVCKDNEVRLSADGSGRVYIPYTSIRGYEELLVHGLAASVSSGDAAAKKYGLLELAGGQQEGYREINPYNWKNWLLRLWGIFFFVVYVRCCFMLVKKGIRLSKQLYARAAKEKEELYGIPMLKKERRHIMAYVGKMAAGIGLAAAGFGILRLFPMLSLERIPEEDLFRVSYYWNTFVEQVQMWNSHMLEGNYYWQNLFIIGVFTELLLFTGWGMWLLVIGNRKHM